MRKHSEKKETPKMEAMEHSKGFLKQAAMMKDKKLGGKRHKKHHGGKRHAKKRG